MFLLNPKFFQYLCTSFFITSNFFFFQNRQYFLINKFRYNRLGLAISTKLCKAVGRNRIKRVIRAAYLDLIREYNLKQGYDIVFIWNKNVNIDNISYFEIRNDIKYIFRRFGLIIEDNDEECF